MSLLEMKIDEDAGTMTLVLSLEEKPKASKSGKSLVVADSGGSASAGILMNKRGQRANESKGGKEVFVSAVAYIEK